MNNSHKRTLKFWWVFTAFIFLHISNLQAQPSDARPIIKYTIKNYSSISKAICDIYPTIVRKPLQQYRPIPFPPVAGFNAIPGVDINEVPGIAATNFLGGGSPEIKGLVKNVAVMTAAYANRIRKNAKTRCRATGKPDDCQP